MNNIADYFKNKSHDPKDWKSYPIVLRWLQTKRMTDALSIINVKLDYLKQNSKQKIQEWFSSDKALTQITSERFVLDYVRTQNSNYIENFKGNGVDAYLKIENSHVGLEVTTINEAIAEWIFQERVLMYLFSHNYNITDNIKISYTLKALESLNYTLDLVEDTGKKIINKKYDGNDSVVIRRLSSGGDYISWELNNKGFNLFSILEKRLYTILTSKNPQLKKNEKNILFIGVNQLPINELNPDIFAELSHPKRFTSEIITLEQIVSKNLPKYVVGVCFFVYTLNSDTPMYPLKIFWRDSLNVLPINL